MAQILIYSCIYLGLSLCGVIMALLGLRGRRVGQEPSCGRCEADLSEAAESTTHCPKCQADLSGRGGVRYGRLRRSPALMAVGILLVLAGLTLFFNYFRSLSIDWYRHWPNSWLLRRVENRDPTTLEPVLRELTTRIITETLTPDLTQTLVGKALAAQADRSRPWTLHWGNIVEAARPHGLVSDERWQTYWAQSIHQLFRVRPAVVQGEPIPLFIDWSQVRLGIREDPAHAQRLQLTVQSCGIDAAGIPQTVSSLPTELTPSSQGTLDWLFDSPDPVPSVGPHRVHATILATVTEVGRDHTMVAAWTVNLQADFQIVPPGSDTVTLIADPSYRKAVEKSVVIHTIRVLAEPGAPSQLSIQGNHDDLPIDLAYAVQVRIGKDAWPIGLVQMHKAGAAWSIIGPCPPSLPSIVDVLLEPSKKAARLTVDMAGIWDGQITATGFRVRREASFHPVTTQPAGR